VSIYWPTNIAFFAVLYIIIGCFTSDFRSLAHTLPYAPKTTPQNFGSALGLGSQVSITAAPEYRVVSQVPHKTDV